MHQFTLRNKKERHLFIDSCIILMILSLTLLTVFADEVMEKKDHKSSINGVNKSDKTFFAFIDDKTKGFEQSIEYMKSKGKSIYKISRINVDGPYYDGISGYNVFMVRKDSFPTPTDVLTLMVRGHFRLFGYDIEKNKIYAYRTCQIGADSHINNIAIISKKNIKEKDKKFDESHIPDEIDIEIIGPPGEYDYGSCSPDGRYCILFGAKDTLIDINTRTVLKEDLGISYPTPGSFEYAVVVYDLSGEYLELKWETNTSGKLICRDKNKKILKIVKIDLGKYIDE